MDKDVSKTETDKLSDFNKAVHLYCIVASIYIIHGETQ